MAKRKKPQRNRRPWTAKDIDFVQSNAQFRTVSEVAKSLRRTHAAVQQWAMRNGISFRA